MTGAVSQPGRLAVQHIKNHRDQDGDGSRHVVRVEDGKDRKHAAKEVAGGKQIGNQVHGGFSALAVLSKRVAQTSRFHRNSPRMVSPPLTRSPTATFRAVLTGTNVSMRDPKRINPKRSPRCTRSPVDTQQTMRRA